MLDALADVGANKIWHISYYMQPEIGRHIAHQEFIRDSVDA